MNFSAINAIIFDLGNVIIDIDPSLTSRAFARLGNQIEEPNGWQLIEHFKVHEKGLVSDDEFRNMVRKTLGKPEITDEHIDHAWNALLLDIGQARVDLLLTLKGQFRTFALSNTNAIHIRKVNQILNQTTKYKGTLDSLFEKAYYSHDIKMSKPDAEIYHHILNTENLNPTQTLFIDDKLENIEAAQKLGIQTIHLEAPHTILDIFAGYVV
jgi:putative hydrolase of the HAD superfamily